jgi:signal recognition particle subunit SRP54
MADMMKTMGKRGGLMQRMMGGGGGGGPSPAEIERMQAELATLDPKALANLPKGMPGLGGPMPKLPGLGGGGPRLPGLPGFPGKKK